ncbi:pyridoxal phosphate homeostasis protein-like [Panicum virgatum]|uniref:Uncharacterized protein n=1 Tax=Panicum virgatum TaxID=38727 RepID=A0A8T0RQC3_PANVG|nr:pyridoxal phosphate homeostasis protein-like [Panicum virgatum]KAG2588592.1 hypothetical protein PVAP13_5NG242924 [Panicum virgatum]
MASVAAAASLRSVLSRAQQVAARAGRAPGSVRVVEVSKTKPVPVIRGDYDAGHRCFGENYVQELIDKAPQAQWQVGGQDQVHLRQEKLLPGHFRSATEAGDALLLPAVPGGALLLSCCSRGMRSSWWASISSARTSNEIVDGCGRACSSVQG